ncbi:hypothetical protein [Microbulbifer hydrolyticus]|uniref:Uncharacterized protein n=1 Tax=Microbulbifer hydrolyticus TaxID=48074 RepID=A0A6P1T8X8_9GAMM|nr:hypothetical protein [Microbulbifer hydrolyticus]MBB5213253.1 hypothetical protein [Microbulbifer hydrolyticus]QHQ38487.1 hypothetical protein GTQ55_05425 [Microbulbifer hydrolyticus]
MSDKGYIDSDADVREPGPEKPSAFLILSTILFTALSMCANFVGNLLKAGSSPEVFGYAVGGAVASLFWGFIVLCVFHFLTGYKSQRAKFKQFLGFQVLYLLTGILGIYDAASIG